LTDAVVGVAPVTWVCQSITRVPTVEISENTHPGARRSEPTVHAGPLQRLIEIKQRKEKGLVLKQWDHHSWR
jgi:hypothetical protein